MNLIQVQERLKDLPRQALIAYANGANPDVAPYLAMLEMNRRKRMEEQARPAEPPTGTVKDQLEQQAGLAALQGMRMGQAQQQMMQGAAAQPMPVPEGAPQPDMQPEATGIANAAAQPGVMQPDVLSMAGGGIVAFSKGTEEAVDSSSYEDDEDDDEEEQGAESLPVEAQPASNFRDLESLPVDEQPVLDAKTREGLASLGVTPFAPPSQAQAPQAPQGPQSTAQQLAGRQAALAQRLAAVPVAPELATRESMAKQDPAMYGVLNKPIGGDYLAGLQALMAKQGAQDEAARKQLEINKRMDLWKAFSDYGQASRGQRGLGGIGALARSLGPSMEKRGEEAAAIEAAPIKREELLNKAKYDIQELQRAQGNNDLKTVNAQKAKLFDTATKLYASGNAALAREIAAIAGIEEKKITAAAQVEAARIRAAARGQGTPRTTDFREKLAIKYNALVASGQPPGEATMNKAYELVAETEGKAAGQMNAETRRQAEADKWYAEQMMRPELRRLRRSDPVKYEAKMTEIEEEYRRRTGTAPTAAPKPAPSSSAPLGSPGNPIPIPG
jgi:hypothetical protein